jgi:hypothetical protein
METSVQNPFVISGYISPKYFCDRKNETEKILKAIESGRNITLIALRRIGKTVLLRHVKHLLESGKKPVAVIYTDLLPTLNGRDLLNTIANALINIKVKERKFPEKVLSVLSSLRPRMTIDPFTGQPCIDLRIETESEVQYGLEQILTLIAGIDKEIVFILDEFQQISNYPEKNIEHLLRTIVQTHPSVRFIFSGSSRHMLENMFTSAKRPFYQSSELMYLDRIASDEYSKFIIKNFLNAGITIDDAVITKLFEWTRLHTWYIQYACNKLYESNEKKIEIPALNHLFYNILSESELQYINYRNLLPGSQFRLLIAFACENGVGQPTSGRFISKYGLTSASSVKVSLKSLEEKEMIVKENSKWFVYDVFFARWLEYNYKEI